MRTFHISLETFLTALSPQRKNLPGSLSHAHTLSLWTQCLLNIYLRTRVGYRGQTACYARLTRLPLIHYSAMNHGYFSLDLSLGLGQGPQSSTMAFIRSCTDSDCLFTHKSSLLFYFCLALPIQSAQLLQHIQQLSSDGSSRC